MLQRTHNLGRLQSVHGVSPVFLQRVIIVAVLSFVFFLLMLTVFFVRQNIGYFILSTAFLIVYILTMLGWLKERRNVFEIYENGFVFRGRAFRWDEIAKVEGRTGSRLTGGAKMNFEINKKSGEKIVLTEAVEGAERIVELIAEKIEALSPAGDEAASDETES